MEFDVTETAPSPDGKRNIILIAANPKAGSQSRDRHLREIADWLGARGMTVRISSDLVHVEAEAQQLHRAGRLRALVGAGGDGTLAELVNRTEPGTPIAIYPAGTANLLARYVGVSTDCETFGQMLLDAETVDLDAGRAGGRLFLSVCSCGFDAEVVNRLHEARRGHIKMFSYLRPILRTLASYTFPEMRVYYEQNGATVPSPVAARWVFVSNLPCYAGGLKPGAGASGTDGLLHLCALERGGLRGTLRYLPSLFRGTQEKLADCTIVRAKSFRVEAATCVPYELDGDPAGNLPVDIDVLPRRLTLVVPTMHRSF